MIYGNISNERNRTIYNPVIVKALDALKNTDFSSEQPVYEIEGKEIFIRYLKTQTKNIIDVSPEIHERYADLHYLIKGRERIYFSLELPEKIIKRNVEDDHIFFEKFKRKNYIDMNEGDFAIFFPEDVHMAAITSGEPAEIKKAIVKIALNQLK